LRQTAWILEKIKFKSASYSIKGLKFGQFLEEASMQFDTIKLVECFCKEAAELNI